MNNCGLSNFEFLLHIKLPCQMQFKLDFTFKTRHTYSIRNSFLMLGSCFADEVGSVMHSELFDVMVNPHGVVFNPMSLSELLKDYNLNKKYSHDDLLFHSGKFMSLKHHGKFRHYDAVALLNQLNDATENASAYLLHTDVVILTFGSAWIYEWVNNKEIVANCHKLPASMFTKRLLTIEEIVDAYVAVLSADVFKQKKIIFTVSPVRYIRDGLHENNISKSILFLAIQRLVSIFSNADYFPSYEIVTDELRDYRFFKEDMIHPNGLAIKFVYDKFCENVLDSESKDILKEIRPVIKMKNHRSIFQNSIEQQKLDEVLLQKLNNLLSKYPFLSDRINQK